MQESLIVLMAALPVYLILALGPVLRRTGWLTPEMDKGVMSMAVHLFFPCLILDKMLGSEILRDFNTVLSAASVGFFLIAAGTAIGWFLAPALGLKLGSGRRTFAVAGGLQNYGYIAIPLILYLFPRDDVMAILFTHNLGVELAMWTIGLMLLSGDSKPSLKIFLKGPIIAVVLGVFLLQTGGDHFIPDIIRRTFNTLGNCAIPISLLLVGTALTDLVGKVKFDWKIGLGGILVRLALIPILFLLAAKYLPIALELKQVLVVQAALPSAMFPIVLSKHYGGRTDVAAQVVVATAIASMLTMPLMITFGKIWVGV
jgi:predicted permease